MIAWVHQSRPRPSWYDLDPKNRQESIERWEACSAATLAAGGTLVGTFSVRGQSDFERMELWTFAAVDLLEAHWTRLREAAYLDFFDTENLLGMPVPKTAVP